MTLLLVAIALCAASGLPAFLLGRQSAAGQLLATLLMITGGALGITGTLLHVGASDSLRLPWAIPGGEFHVELDGLSAIFLLPIFLIASLGSIYGQGYWRQAEHADNGRKLRLFYGILTAGMALVVLARNAVLFLVAWEVMALAAFFLVTTEDENDEARQAGWLYLAASHLAALCLFALFGLMFAVTGTFTLTPLTDLSPGKGAALFLLALVGFGIKAGIMPLHVWLPSSHATAPSHVSALLSGVILKMGIYGLLRFLALVPQPPLWWGGVLLGLGVISAVLGVAFALGQHDIKRLLAYHSIENIGIIVMGIGLATAGRSLDQPAWVVLGMAGALLHVWNHALFKALLFLGAGSVIHATHTRDMDHLGGLAKAMPITAGCFLIGAVAICGLPPLNGFVSELFIYLGLFRTLGLQESSTWAWAAFAVPALALVGALAVACFVKVYGTVFLGLPRSEHATHAHEAPLAMRIPMLLLAGLCLFIGLAPALVAPMLQDGVTAWMPRYPSPLGERGGGEGAPGVGVELATLAPLGWISVAGGILLLLCLVVGIIVRTRLRESATTVTWDCGYAAPSPRMQYTSSSFAQMLVELFGWALRPRKREPVITELFPQKASFHSEVPETVLDEAVAPAASWLARQATWARVFQQGSIQAYLLYVFVVLIVLLLIV